MLQPLMGSTGRLEHGARRTCSTFLRLTALTAAFAVGLALCGSSGAVETKPSGQAKAGKGARLAQELGAALASARVPSAERGALAVDLDTGKVIFSRNPDGSLEPASNEKLTVTFTALALLGPQFQISTDVLGEGERQGSEWKGSLVLQGHGDPDLSTSDLKQLARQIRHAGIRSVSGGVVGDESFFDSRRTAPGWKGYFLINECAPLSALSLDRGIATYASPPLVAAQAFDRALTSAGVTVKGRPRVGTASEEAEPLASVESPPLWKILRFMDRESDNYTAEMLLKQLGIFTGGRGTTANGAAVVTATLETAGIPLAGVRIVDGSGLSRLDRLTPAAITQLLLDVWSDETLRKPFVGALSISGRLGTLHLRMRTAPAKGNVYAKTGTTNEASALSGFVRDRFAFSILQNGYPISSFRARASQDRFATLLAGQ
jgi:D-alanyl-D-alanine carboxypeptidase/D-alanyl-D-alanine-endopeptidase (penicillin-binding protein 4)